MKTPILAIAMLFAAACSKSSDHKGTKTGSAAPKADAARFEISVTEDGFVPDDVAVPSGKPVVLVFDRKTDETCAKKVVLDLGDGQKVTKDLPLNQPVEVAATFPKAGKLAYACGMDMFHGTITVQ